MYSRLVGIVVIVVAFEGCAAFRSAGILRADSKQNKLSSVCHLKRLSANAHLRIRMTGSDSDEDKPLPKEPDIPKWMNSESYDSGPTSPRDANRFYLDKDKSLFDIRDRNTASGMDDPIRRSEVNTLHNWLMP